MLRLFPLLAMFLMLCGLRDLQAMPLGRGMWWWRYQMNPQSSNYMRSSNYMQSSNYMSGSSMNSMQYSSPYSAPNRSMAPLTTTVPAAAPALPLLSGIVNAQGQVAWPLGLQILRPALETKALRERLESTLLGTAQEATQSGHAQAQVLAEANQAIARLQQAFQDQRPEMAEGTVQDAAAFLSRLQTALQAMR